MITVQDRPRRENVIYAPEYIPVCPVHEIDMIAYSRRQVMVYYKCSHRGCDCTDKVSRKLFIVAPPRQP